MSVSYPVDIKPLEDSGQTDEQIAAALLSSGVTESSVPLDQLLYTLNLRGVLTKLPNPDAQGRRWVGTAITMQTAIEASGDQAAIDAFRQWFSHITNDRNTHWQSDEPIHAAAFWVMSQTFGGQPGMPSVEDFAAVADLGGGWKFASLVDGAAVAGIRDAWNQSDPTGSRIAAIEALRAEIANTYINPAVAGTDDAAAVRAAIKAGL